MKHYILKTGYPLIFFMCRQGRRENHMNFFRKKSSTLLLPILAIILTTSISCGRKEPVKIGFVGGLTGRNYNLGVSGRNGLALAVDEINEHGGIKGRPVELLIRDDKQEPVHAVQAVHELIAGGVVAIVGHMTSSMSKETLPIINEKRMVMISPTTSSSFFTGKDDYFITLYSSTKVATLKFSSYIRESMKIRSIVVIYDLSNRVYSESWFENFRKNFTAHQGARVTGVAFMSGRGQTMLDVAKSALRNRPEGILIVANAFDTAILCQQVRKIDPHIQILGSAWALTSDILQNGGRAVEGVVFLEMLNTESRVESYLAFREKYQKRFGGFPDFAAILAYEAGSLLGMVLPDAADSAGIKQKIIGLGKYQGLFGPVSIDKNGDVERTHFIFTIKNNRFAMIKEL